MFTGVRGERLIRASFAPRLVIEKLLITQRCTIKMESAVSDLKRRQELSNVLPHPLLGARRKADSGWPHICKTTSLLPHFFSAAVLIFN